MLLAWLFGVALSVANACALHLSGDVKVTLAVQAEAFSHHHHDDHGHDHHGQANCLDFCDESSVAASSWQSNLHVAGLAWLPIVFVSLVVPAPLPLRARSTSAPPNPSGVPPIPIAFLRLAL